MCVRAQRCVYVCTSYLDEVKVDIRALHPAGEVEGYRVGHFFVVQSFTRKKAQHHQYRISVITDNARGGGGEGHHNEGRWGMQKTTTLLFQDRR